MSDGLKLCDCRAIELAVDLNYHPSLPDLKPSQTSGAVKLTVISSIKNMKSFL
jgi:hypothetical protein